MKVGDLVKNSCKTFKLDDNWRDYKKLYKEGPPPGISTGWTGFDRLFTILRGQLNILSGVPSSGKSEWIESMAINLAREHNWNIFVYSPENYPIQFYMMKLAEKYVKQPFFGRGTNPPMTEEEMEKAYEFIQDHFEIIDSSEHPYDLRRILNSVEQSEQLYSKKFDMVILDPWNEIEVLRPRGENETEYVSKSLSRCRRVARKNSLSFWIVAHPTKMLRGKNGKFPEPSLYDISGSAHWRNKADNGIILHRSDDELKDGSAAVKAKVCKIKNRFYGSFGEHFFEFQHWNSGFIDWQKSDKQSELGF